MRNIKNKIKAWWKHQDASEAKEALAKEAGERGKQLFYLSIAGFVFPGKLFEQAISKWLDFDISGVLSAGQGKIAAAMLAVSMMSLALSFVLSLKPKHQAKTKKKH